MNRNLIRIAGGSNRRTERGRKTGIPGESHLSGLCDCIVSIILFQADYTQIGSDYIDIIGIQTEFVRNSYEKRQHRPFPRLIVLIRLYWDPGDYIRGLTRMERTRNISVRTMGPPRYPRKELPGYSEASDDVRMRFQKIVPEESTLEYLKEVCLLPNVPVTIPKWTLCLDSSHHLFIEYGRNIS